jgi:hypothetical protein
MTLNICPNHRISLFWISTKNNMISSKWTNYIHIQYIVIQMQNPRYSFWFFYECFIFASPICWPWPEIHYGIIGIWDENIFNIDNCVSNAKVLNLTWNHYDNEESPVRVSSLPALKMGRVLYSLWRAAPMIYKWRERLLYCTVTRYLLLTYNKILSIVTDDFQPLMAHFYDENVSHVFHS